jgi:predicted MFS family arabinose efflux permease
MSLVRIHSFAARHPLGRLIGGLGAGQIIGWGSSFYLPTILAHDMSADIGLSEEVIYGGVTVMLLVSAALSPSIGRALDRGGARLIMTIGAAITGLALLLLAGCFDLTSYLLAWAVMGGAGAMFLTNSGFVAVAQLAGAGARRAMTILMLFTGSASSVAWPMLSYMNGALGWRMTCIVLAMVQLLVCAPFHWWLLGRKVETSAASGGAVVVPEGLSPERYRAAMLILAPCMCLSGFITWGLSVHIVDLLRHLGAEGARAVWLASLLGVLQVGARLVDLALGSRHSPLLLGIIASALLSFAFIIPLSGLGPGSPAAAFMLVYGIASGSMSLARVMIPLSLFGSRSYGRASGILSAFQNVAYALAPLVYATIFERVGTGAGMWMSFAAGALTLIGLSMLFRMRRA